MMDQNKADIGFITEPVTRPDWTYRVVDKVRYVLYVPLGYSLSTKQQISLEDLSDQPLFLPEKGCLTEREVMRVLRQNKIHISRMIKTTPFQL